ncbi:apolipoprotein N-acyltransferase [Shewanella schlegeliana]|uniref:Apolipoprotein N-acyltransferase n=1 Tax=Shewanella schlegeliana TaxID=190308 RepID=A0ABS1SYS0_9GAMM|nr:apolipoprotein N-acyltransferase [Shewanella schlegeliana]MBL4913679.1 apolipoprotein N-acyltransferase [Shewanella schlegeliana]MCL1108570.1 apolipoprotein N-acyltransferase [Shewanella schlegeliana]GIU31088.1 apolipoprotein N-acyltransferase [Shewanella schlegeliana]
MLNKLRALAHHPRSKMVLAYAAGATTALSFAPYSIWPIYLLAMAYAVHQSANLTAKQVFSYWLSFGFGCFSVGISWVHVSMDVYGGMPLIASIALMALLALYLALYPALAGCLLQKLAPKTSVIRNLLVFPALWTITEWARGWVLTGFPWLWGGYSQTEGPLKPIASMFGTLGLSFIVALLAGAIALLAVKRWQSLAIAIPVLAVLTIIAPMTSQVTPNGETIKVALVQGNIPQSMKWDPDALWPTMLKYMDLSRPEFSADLIIWPEAAIPAPEYMVKDFLYNANKVANLNNTAIITGIISNHGDAFYNSLIVLGNYNHKQQSEADYLGDGTNEFKKHHLLPIGEFVPFESLLRPLAPFFNLPMSSFNRGNFIQPNLNAVGHQISPAICYEIAFPEQLRANMNDTTDLLMTVSNDAWFGTSNGPLQHMEIAQMRSVELGRPLVRATNNGVTAVVDEQGNITQQLPQFEAGVLVADIQLMKGHTLFTTIGQWPVLILSFLIALGAMIRKRMQSHS